MKRRRISKPAPMALAASCLLTLLLAFSPAAGAEAVPIFDSSFAAFSRELPAEALGRLAVQHAGRVGPLDSLARERLSLICGEDRPAELPPAVAYLELYFRAGAYLDRPVLYVREGSLRRRLARLLGGEDARALRNARRLPPGRLLGLEARERLRRAGRAAVPRDGAPDVDGFAADARDEELRRALAEWAGRGELRSAIERLALRAEAFLAADGLAVLPGAARWRGLETAGAADEAGAAALWRRLAAAWRARDAESVRSLTRRFAAAQGRADAAGLRPASWRRELEIFYNRASRFHWAWAAAGGSLLAWVLVLAGAGRRARVGALALLTATAGLLVAGFLVRWLISGRPAYLPPILNQYEGMIASAMLATLAAAILEFTRRGGGVFGLGASAYATAILLACALLPGRLGARISAPPGILASPVMAAHVATILLGHALLGIAAVISLAYLLAAALGGRRILEKPLSSPPDLCEPAGPGRLARIDRCNLVASQAAVLAIMTGTALGSWWGDFAWGRFWGWDPKETWTLVTILLLLGALHVRFAVSQTARGLATAIGVLLAAGAMLVNWIVVNYLLPGLHSYA
jgi:ABC-type transport system involved in cytochrome c biogenesis permease subunit